MTCQFRTYLPIISLVFGLNTEACTKRKKKAAASAQAEVYDGFQGFATLAEKPKPDLPAGSCGLPPILLESQHLVAMNDRLNLIPSGKQAALGKSGFSKGEHCGRWIQASLDQICAPANNVAPGQKPYAEMPNGQKAGELCGANAFKGDDKTGGQALFLIAGNCSEGDLPCLNDPNHIKVYGHDDLKFSGANGEVKDPTWDRRRFNWHFTKAPAEITTPNFYAASTTSTETLAFLASRLRNGLGSVEYFAANQWQIATRNANALQAFDIKGEAGLYKVKLKDVDGVAIEGGREYIFRNPCDSGCQKITQITLGDNPVKDQTREAPVIPTDATDSSEPNKSDEPNPSEAPKNFLSHQSGNGLNVEVKKTKVWDSGYCTQVVVSNSAKYKQFNWFIKFAGPGLKITSHWNLWATTFPILGHHLINSKFYWQSLDPGARLDSAGFCVEREWGDAELSVIGSY